MQSNSWNKLGRILLSISLGISILAGGALTAKAEEAPNINYWSAQDIWEGTTYGLFPAFWYYDDTFQQPIDTAKFKSLITETSGKLDKLGFKKKKGSLSFPTKSSTITRGTVLQSLYKVLASYELPKDFEMGQYTSIEYLLNKGIVNGTIKGLNLDASCTVEQAAVFASRLVEYTYETAQAGSKGLLWKVTKGNNTVYLLGSVSYASHDMYPLQKHVKEAFDQSDYLWVESYIDEADQDTQRYYQKSQIYFDGTTIKDHVSKETYDKLNKATVKLNLPEYRFDRHKPFAVNSALSGLTLYNSPEEYIEVSSLKVSSYFITKALLSDKPIHEFESARLYIDLLSSIPLDQQEKELNQWLDLILDPSFTKLNLPAKLQQAQLQWTKGDLTAFSKSVIIQRFTEKADNEPILGKRDKNMTDQLTKLLDAKGESSHFVVIDAAHFVIKDMIIDQLKQKGYTVEFIK